MHDMKQQKKGQKKLRNNRRKRQKQPLNLRKLLHRTLRVGVFGFSAVLLVVGCGLLIQVLLASDLFRIEAIQVEGNSQINREEIVGLSDINTGDMTFDLDLHLIGRKIAENPWVREAQVSRIFPKQVVIRIEERHPQAIINLDYLYYLDERGEVFKVLGSGDSLDYPVVTGFNREELQQGDSKSGRQLKAIISLIENLEQREIFGLDQVSEVHREAGGGICLYTYKNAVKIRLGRCDFIEKIDRLERLYVKLEKRLPVLDYIDLNVDERIIVRIERAAAQARG
ncbi:MAG TPA: FtsQ-type POTRA domain-containing protein [Geopsychrobacteraceae bacterium]|nr:FtsQ-type POTRA domain-containing protein [Geopsychrobacteraceae bacterium]